ncbi:MAG: hypothetical protein A3D44_01575 [Candidatus Staskawiczbacteria bacterium RIFCSPHIGHO2_02_FULL_42_22]|uniref:DUF5652 domain-containing protein n=1 Tax=Candidatus Staskawiczbacteria bacterium RIFCSPHIGHO2_02_FULL_42_22 TaxID=1802207 RepID=A0A1G2HZW6_9BACT|nr:MAG: hypothetical protein A3D44_01575 [Candidatus Staskawiczbacteria bacterium RIFCSPHIGHO2_02_FULL_42_22]
MDSQTTAIINILNDPKYTLLFLVLLIWGLIWKGIALWRAAKNGQRNWFIAMLVVNTFGILEMAYIFYFNKKSTAVKKDEKTN